MVEVDALHDRQRRVAVFTFVCPGQELINDLKGLHVSLSIMSDEFDIADGCGLGVKRQVAFGKALGLAGALGEVLEILVRGVLCPRLCMCNKECQTEENRGNYSRHHRRASVDSGK